MAIYGQRVFWYGSGNSSILLKMAVKNLNIVTYNLHGFNQGLPYLNDLLCHNDILRVQEHWLSSADGQKLNNLNNHFSVISSFAVDSVLSRGILRGRPFGGLAIFIRSDIIKKLACICVSD